MRPLHASDPLGGHRAARERWPEVPKDHALRHEVVDVHVGAHRAGGLGDAVLELHVPGDLRVQAVLDALLRADGALGDAVLRHGARPVHVGGQVGDPLELLRVVARAPGGRAGGLRAARAIHGAHLPTPAHHGGSRLRHHRRGLHLRRDVPRLYGLHQQDKASRRAVCNGLRLA